MISQHWRVTVWHLPPLKEGGYYRVDLGIVRNEVLTPFQYVKQFIFPLFAKRALGVSWFTPGFRLSPKAAFNWIEYNYQLFHSFPHLRPIFESYIYDFNKYNKIPSLSPKEVLYEAYAEFSSYIINKISKAATYSETEQPLVDVDDLMSRCIIKYFEKVDAAFIKNKYNDSHLRSGLLWIARTEVFHDFRANKKISERVLLATLGLRRKKYEELIEELGDKQIINSRTDDAYFPDDEYSLFLSQVLDWIVEKNPALNKLPAYNKKGGLKSTTPLRIIQQKLSGDHGDKGFLPSLQDALINDYYRHDVMLIIPDAKTAKMVVKEEYLTRHPHQKAWIDDIFKAYRYDDDVIIGDGVYLSDFKYKNLDFLISIPFGLNKVEVSFVDYPWISPETDNMPSYLELIVNNNVFIDKNTADKYPGQLKEKYGSYGIITTWE